MYIDLLIFSSFVDKKYTDGRMLLVLGCVHTDWALLSLDWDKVWLELCVQLHCA